MDIIEVPIYIITLERGPNCMGIVVVKAVMDWQPFKMLDSHDGLLEVVIDLHI